MIRGSISLHSASAALREVLADEERRFAPESWGRSASRPYPAVFDLGLMPFVAPRLRVCCIFEKDISPTHSHIFENGAPFEKNPSK